MAVVEKTIDILGDEILSAFIISREIPTGNPADLYDEEVKSLRDHALSEMKGLQSVNLPFVTSVGILALSECPNLVSVKLPLCAEFKNYGALCKCAELEDVDLPLLQSGGSMSFLNCVKLKTISLPNLLDCSSQLFEGCVLLESVSLPKFEQIGSKSFKSCSAIKQIDLPSAKTIGSNMIDGCSSLEVINLGPNIINISSTAFQGAPEGLVINMPVSEGVISGAPWGATKNIIINYDTPYSGSVPMPED